MARHLWLVILCGLLLVGFGGCSQRPAIEVESAEQPSAPPLDPALFQEDQAGIAALQEWGGQLVVQADRLYSLDVQSAAVTPIDFPVVECIHSLASQGKDRPLALVEGGGQTFLLRKDGEEWVRRDLPREGRRRRFVPGLFADSSAIMLLGGQGLYRQDGNAWVPIPLKPRPPDVGGPRHYLLDSGQLYLGFDIGEWGGRLLTVDAATGEWKDVRLGPDSLLPVHEIKRAPDGAIWVVEGLAWVDGGYGQLHTYDGRQWRTICNSSARHRSNWTLPTACLDAVSFDAQDRVYVLSGNLGLARLDGDKWTHLTPGWPKEHQYVCGLHIDPAGVAVIATRQAGVLLFNLRSKQIRRVTLPK